MDRQAVKVYVRAGAHEGERTLSFRPPKEVPQREWLERGFAVDGNSVIASVSAATYVNTEDDAIALGDADPEVLAEYGRTLIKALHAVELWLVKWLDALGYDVEFA
jgi:hypothetical protein